MSSPHPAVPSIDFVPLGKITVFAVTEGELLEIKRGSADSFFFALGMSCLSLCIPTALSILALDPKISAFVSHAYAMIAVVSGVAGVVLLFLWRYYNTHTHSAIGTIMARRPPAGVQSAGSPLPPAMSALAE